ncbi:UNVERIFIED_ORG: hypothetical protein CLV66_109119 [Actinomadura viridilutea]
MEPRTLGPQGDAVGRVGRGTGPELPPPPPGEPLPPLPPNAFEALPQNYDGWTREPVVYLPVVLGGVQIGCLWASTRHKAAGFLYLPEAIDREEYFYASTIWWERLGEAYRQGLPAREAILRWRGAPEDPRAGGIPADARERELPSLAALHEMVAPGVPAPEGPLIQDGKLPDGTPVDRSQGWGPLVSSPLPTYAPECDGPIRYVPVVLRDAVVGYVWASVTGEAAGYLPREAAGQDGQVAAGLWQLWLSRSFEEGASSLVALRRCKAMPEDRLSRVIGADAEERELPSLQALRELARQ